MLGKGGLPIGLIGHASWETVQIALQAGDKLLIHSDGFTECPAPNGDLLDDGGLMRLFEKLASKKDLDLLKSLQREVELYSGTSDFPDDISAALIEFTGAD